MSEQKENNIVTSSKDNYQNTEGNVEIIENEEKTYKNKDSNSENRKERSSSNTTIIRGALMITNLCLGVSIFTFAIRVKYFGLVWFVLSCILVGGVTYWSIMRGVIASSKNEEDDYSELTEKILGKKIRIILNIIIIIYTYAVIMMFLALIYALFGRFIHSVGYTNKYEHYEKFNEEIWGKPYIKFPVYIGMALGLSLMCLIKDMNKLNFASYIGVFAVIYSLFVVLVECKNYYELYKKEKYIKEDKNTHPNWINLSKAFTKKLEFFKGLASLFCANAIHPGTFPVFVGFKYQKEGLKKMKLATFFGTLLTTGLYALSMIISYLTNPYDPEDLIIYRKSKGGKDIAMIIAKLFVSLSIIFTIPPTYFPLRLSIANSFTKGIISTKFNIIFTFISCYACAAIASVYDKILNYLSYIGGFLSVFICYLIPILLYIYTSGKPITYWKNIIEITAAVILCIIGFMGGIITIIDDVTN